MRTSVQRTSAHGLRADDLAARLVPLSQHTAHTAGHDVACMLSHCCMQTACVHVLSSQNYGDGRYKHSTKAAESTASQA